MTISAAALKAKAEVSRARCAQASCANVYAAQTPATSDLRGIEQRMDEIIALLKQRH